MQKVHKSIIILFHILFFAIPLVFYSRTSELFEFNKIVLLYLITILIVSLWATLCVLEKKFIRTKTPLDTAIFVFLLSQLISTIFSIEPRTSILGYYSRWNGGLLSSISYAALYFAFVTFIDVKQVLKLIKTLLISTLVSSIWGVFEHFGHSPSCLLITGKFNVDCWVQDVQLRVFSTFGQPNWQAAWIVALLPATWGSIILSKDRNIKIGYILLGILFFATLLFTKSRSGLLALGVSATIFWGLSSYVSLKKRANQLRQFFIINIILVSVIIIFGSPWTPSLVDKLTTKHAPTSQTAPQNGTSLESGGTESGQIRKIVWSGAINVWKIYPLTGSGVETFAMSYYQGRTLAHNNTSEWNFLYNKAHNEFLNFLATTGILGFGAYLYLVFVILKSFLYRQEPGLFQIAFLSGFISILITNFFGFSVVPISILFFLFPALSFASASSKNLFSFKELTQSSSQKLGIIGIVSVALFLLFNVANYWRADLLYAKAQNESEQGNYQNALKDIDTSISITPNEPIFHATIAGFYADLTKAAEASNDKELATTFKNEAISESKTTINLAPYNVKLLKQTANTYQDLGDIDNIYYQDTLDILGKLQRLAPTDPSIAYQKGLTLAKIGQTTDAISYVEKAIAMKPDYKIARRLLAFLYENDEQKDKAKEQLQYILKNISPDDIDIQKELNKLK